MNTGLHILSPGLFTTVQDRGRYGYQRFGVPVSGAMDEFALRSANLLVGNSQEQACIEMTVLGPTIQFQQDSLIAATGADLTGMLNGSPLPRWQAVKVPKDSELSFNKMQDGMRAYLAVAGGFDVPVVMGSRSTYVLSGIGGFQGRPIAAGDTLEIRPGGITDSREAPSWPLDCPIPTYGDHHEIRVIMGPQDNAFGQDALDTLFGENFTVGLDSDRMGYKLEGKPLTHLDKPDIVSDGNPPGAIQVSGDGLPTILLADRGTTGGYTKIATVITADLGKISQAVPNQTVSLKEVTLDEANYAAVELECVLAAIEFGIDERISITVDNNTIKVADALGSAITSIDPRPDRTSIKKATAKIGEKTFEFDVQIGYQKWLSQ